MDQASLPRALTPLHTLPHVPDWQPVRLSPIQTGLPHSIYSLGQKIPLYLLKTRSNSIRQNSYSHHRNTTKPFSLWYCNECCLHFFFFLWVWPDTLLLPRDPLVWKWRKSISFPQRGSKVSHVWQLLFYQRGFEWIKMRGTRNWVKILCLRTA